MELGNQIKMLRKEKSLSQDRLAEMIYVSRQTISNWENDKSYPDIHSLVLLSQVLEVSVDQLIKGDIKMMQEQINQEDIVKFKHIGYAYTLALIAVIITPIPLVYFLSTSGVIIWIVIYGIAFLIAGLAEKEKKKFNMQTYKEILAFMEGKQLDEIDKAREEGKRPYQKILYALATALIALIVSLVMIKFFNIF